MNFTGDSVLLGFNCIVFDSRFMVRVGRYSNIVIENKYSDVMRFAGQFKEKLGIGAPKVSLQELADKLGIENPRAHRALADAVTMIFSKTLITGNYLERKGHMDRFCPPSFTIIEHTMRNIEVKGVRLVG